MKKPKQLPLIKPPRTKTKLWWITQKSTYGGSMNYRKVPRPFSASKLTHVVFKARLGNGIWFSKSRSSIQKLIDQVAERYQIKVKDVAINHDHLHILFSTQQRDNQIKFLRLLAAEIGRKYKNIYAQWGQKKVQNFWIARPFTRLVSWNKKSLRNIRDYIKRNRDEALGFIEYKPRQHRLTQFLENWEKRLTSTA